MRNSWRAPVAADIRRARRWRRGCASFIRSCRCAATCASSRISRSSCRTSSRASGGGERPSSGARRALADVFPGNRIDPRASVGVAVAFAAADGGDRPRLQPSRRRAFSSSTSRPPRSAPRKRSSCAPTSSAGATRASRSSSSRIACTKSSTSRIASRCCAMAPWPGPGRRAGSATLTCSGSWGATSPARWPSRARRAPTRDTVIRLRESPRSQAARRRPGPSGVARSWGWPGWKAAGSGSVLRAIFDHRDASDPGSPSTARSRSSPATG